MQTIRQVLKRIMQNDIAVGVYGLNKNESYTPIFYAQNTDVDFVIFAGRGGRGGFLGDFLADLKIFVILTVSFTGEHLRAIFNDFGRIKVPLTASKSMLLVKVLIEKWQSIRQTQIL